MLACHDAAAVTQAANVATAALILSTVMLTPTMGEAEASGGNGDTRRRR
jgi:hypothetical protein